MTNPFLGRSEDEEDDGFTLPTEVIRIHSKHPTQTAVMLEPTNTNHPERDAAILANILIASLPLDTLVRLTNSLAGSLHRFQEQAEERKKGKAPAPTKPPRRSKSTKAKDPKPEDPSPEEPTEDK